MILKGKERKKEKEKGSQRRARMILKAERSERSGHKGVREVQE